ncbi:MAG: hypothetical protein HC927_06425 [Deltaproteobacteria bacterium]|nr:hypothetical protein [Deltaproteobacteria bacterium]
MDSGVIVTVTEKCQYDFSYLPASQSETIILARAVNVVPFYYASLWVRLHAIRIGGSATATLIARGTNPSKYDQEKFTLSSAGISVNITGTPPELLTGSQSAIPPFYQIELTATQANPATQIYFEISIDLLLRAA